jgi:hypothetical protein
MAPQLLMKIIDLVLDFLAITKNLSEFKTFFLRTKCDVSWFAFIDIKTQFDGPAGKELLKLQKHALGDERFKFTEDFAGPSNEDSDQNDEPMDVEPSEDMEMVQEKSMSLGVLSSMFGEEVVENSTKQSRELRKPGIFSRDLTDRTHELTGIQFYDPEKPNPQEIKNSDSQLQNNLVDSTGDTTENLNSNGMQVNADFKSIFVKGGPNRVAESFTLFHSTSDSTSPSSSSNPLSFLKTQVPSTIVKATSRQVSAQQSTALASTKFFISSTLHTRESGVFARGDTPFVLTAADRNALRFEVVKRHKNAARKMRSHENARRLVS